MEHQPEHGPSFPKGLGEMVDERDVKLLLSLRASDAVGRAECSTCGEPRGSNTKPTRKEGAHQQTQKTADRAQTGRMVRLGNMRGAGLVRRHDDRIVDPNAAAGLELEHSLERFSRLPFQVERDHDGLMHDPFLAHRDGGPTLEPMEITRVYTGDDQCSHFEDLVIAENETVHGWLTDRIPATGVIFRRTPPGGSLDFHPAPRRQLVITLSGAVELECGDGAVRRLGPGDVLLADDTTGQGHISREVESPRRTVFIPLPEDLDLARWRVS